MKKGRNVKERKKGGRENHQTRIFSGKSQYIGNFMILYNLALFSPYLIPQMPYDYTADL